MVVVAEAGMLSAVNLTALDEAALRQIGCTPSDTAGLIHAHRIQQAALLSRQLAPSVRRSPVALKHSSLALSAISSRRGRGRASRGCG